ncbi:MAG: zinc-ribbon domain-containing protein [Candidatus Lokiarchaeota archaeon]
MYPYDPSGIFFAIAGVVGFVIIIAIIIIIILGKAIHKNIQEMKEKPEYNYPYSPGTQNLPQISNPYHLEQPNESNNVQPQNESKEETTSSFKFCGYCGEKMPGNAKFCPSCGAKT